MKENEFIDGVSHIESDVVERFVSMDNRLQRKANRPKPRRIWLRVGVIAACLAVIVGAVIAVPMMREGESILPEVPTWENPQYTAEEIAELFPIKYHDAATTNTYTKVYVPDAKYLYIDDISDDASLGIYRYTEIPNQLNKQDFRDFIDGILPTLADSLQVTAPQYRIEEKNYSFGNQLSVNTDFGSYCVIATQTENREAFSLITDTASDRKIILDGETVQIDQRLSDEEVIASVQSIKNKLFDIFNVSFSDVKIIRIYNYYSVYGVSRVEIYFYNRDAHPLNTLQSRPVSDYICIEFDNSENYSGDIVSEGILTVAGIRYMRGRNDVHEEYVRIADAKRISLKDAEALLYNGYVFGGHSCPQCMEAQDKISFDGYDFVDIEYVFGRDYKLNTRTVGVPFYAFYKKIGTSENGDSVYAKTYVAAIEVGGYEEFFESQKDKHPNGGEYEFG